RPRGARRREDRPHLPRQRGADRYRAPCRAQRAEAGSATHHRAPAELKCARCRGPRERRVIRLARPSSGRCIDTRRRHAMRPRAPATKAGLALGVLLSQPATPAFVAAAMGQPVAPAATRPDALAAYDDALSRFRAILAERRSQIEAKERLPNLPGQALY